MAGSLNGLAPIRFESVSAVTATPSVQLGTRASDSGIDYVYVYNTGTNSIAQGQMGNIGSASMLSGYSVIVSNAASQVGAHLVVGVAHNAAIPAASYGWLATRGVVYGVPDASEVSMNSNVLVTVGVDGGFVACPATLSTGVPLGVTLNSFITTVGSGKIAFKSPLFS